MHLTRLMNQYGRGKVHATVIPLHWSRPFSQIRDYLRADILVRVGFRPGAATIRGLAFDAFWYLARILNPRARVVYYWIGTDVLNAIEDSKNGNLVRLFFNRALKDYHIAGAPWFVRELTSIGVKATYVCFPSSLPELRSPPPLPETFTILSYVPDQRYEFFGGRTIYAAAQRLPNVQFNIVGGQGEWVPKDLPNLKFHGWQRNMDRFYADASVIVRIVPHDAIGGTVREGLAFARHVIYTYPLPFVRVIEFGVLENLTEAIEGYFRLHQKGELKPNLEGRAYVIKNFDARDATQSLIDALTK